MIDPQNNKSHDLPVGISHGYLFTMCSMMVRSLQRHPDTMIDCLCGERGTLEEIRVAYSPNESRRQTMIMAEFFDSSGNNMFFLFAGLVIIVVIICRTYLESKRMSNKKDE